MLIKLCGFFLIYTAFYLAGGFILSRHRERQKQYEKYLFILSDIKSKLLYAPSEITEMLRSFTVEAYFPFNSCFESIINRIENEEGDLNNIWLTEFAKDANILPCYKDQMDFYTETASALCSQQRNKIINRIDVIINNLTLETENMKTFRAAKATMYAKLFRFFGILLIVLML